MRLTTTKNALKLSFDYDEQLIEKIHKLCEEVGT
jgi:hypothetical protein